MPATDQRDAIRHRASGSGTIVVRDIPIPAMLVDVSPSGCKLRLASDVGALIDSLLPCDGRLNFFGMEYDATAVWLTNDLLGCRFSEYLPLDHVAALLSGGRFLQTPQPAR